MSSSSQRETCPYVGLEPFRAADREYFFGRERDQRVIIQNLLSAPLTVLYGAAGVGKSSLLMAGVVPRLSRDRPRTPVILFRDWHFEDFGLRLKRACIEATWAVGADQPRPAEDLPFDEVVRACGEAARGTVLVLLDQFEDYLAIHPKSADPESFEAQLSRAVNREEVDSGILIAIREASLSRLDRFRERIPGLFGNRLQLRHLDDQGATAAIREPLRVWNERFGGDRPASIEPELVHEVVRQARPSSLTLGSAAGKGDEPEAEGNIEAAFLQLVMSRLWSEDFGSRLLRRATLHRLDEAPGILRAHLNDAMSRTDESTRAVCASFFDRLVTPSGNKVPCSAQDLARWAEDRAAQVPTVLDLLSRERVLRTVPGSGEGVRYEIFSTVLAPAVLDWRARYVEDRRRERAVAEEREQARIRARQFWLRGLTALLAIAIAGWAWSIREGRRAQANELAARSRNAVHYDARAALELGLSAADRNWPFAMTGPTEDALRVAMQVARLSAPAEWTRDMEGRVTSVAVAPDGARVAAATLNRETGRASVAILEAGSGMPEGAPYEGRAGNAGGLAWLPDGGLAAALGTASRVWAGANLSSPPRTLEQGPEINTAFAVSRDGRWLATAAKSQAIRVWDLVGPGDQPKATLPVAQGWLLGLAFSPDGRFVVGASVDPLDASGSHLAAWHVGTGRRVLAVPMRVGSDSVTFARDGSDLVASGRDARVYVWRGVGSLLAKLAEPPPAGGPLPTIGEPRILAGHDDRVRQVVASPDGRRLASASADGTIKLWDAETGENLMTIDAHQNGVEAAAFSPDGLRLLSGGRDRTLRLWSIGQHTGSVNHVAMGASLVATASSDRTVRLWELSEGLPRLRRVLADPALGPAQASHGDAVYRLALNGDGTVLATASYDKRVKLWDVSSGQLLATFGGHEDQLRDVCFSADGEYLASVAADGHALLRRLGAPSEAPIDVEVRKKRQALAVAIHPDPRERLWITGADDGRLQLWSFAGTELGAVGLGDGSVDVAAVAFADGGQRVAALAGRRIHVIPLAELRQSNDRALRQAPVASTRRCRAFAYSAVRGQLAVGCADGAIHLHDSGSLAERKTIRVHEGEVLGLAYGADGRALASVGADRGFVVSPLDVEALAQEARRRLADLGAGR